MWSLWQGGRTAYFFAHDLRRINRYQPSRWRQVWNIALMALSAGAMGYGVGAAIANLLTALGK